MHHAAFASGCCALARRVNEVAEQEDEDEKGKDLERQADEENVVRRGWVLAIAFRHADQSRSNNLDDRSDDVAGHEDGDDPLPPPPQAHPLVAQRADHGCQGCVNGGAEEDGRDDDEKILHYEVDDTVGVPNRRGARAEAKDVANDFEDTGNEGEDGEGPGAVEIEADRVGKYAEGEEDDA